MLISDLQFVSACIYLSVLPKLISQKFIKPTHRFGLLNLRAQKTIK